LPNNNTNDQIVNNFNFFFVNCALSTPYTINNMDTNIDYAECNSFVVHDVTEHEISTVINSLNENKSVGFDKISATILKLLFKYKPDIIVNLINMSFNESVFPEGLKLAIVTPIYKAGDINYLGNYRPISVLPIFSKVIEIAMKNRLYSFLTKYKFFSENQFGFIKGKGTEDALLKFTTLIYESLNNNLKTIAIFIDISKAFDSVNHNILLRKLYLAGIRGNQHDWFKSYLSNRKQIVRLNNFESDSLIIKKGVPQGSILGPLLFIIFINDLCNLPLFGKIITYADDTVLIYSGKTKILLNEMIKSDLDKIKNWFLANDLVINSDKTKYINFNLMPDHANDLVIKYHILCQETDSNCNCPLISKVENIKYLGLFVDQSFKWNYHVKKVNDKLRFFIYAFYHLKKFLSSSFLKQIYFSWVQSIIQYGILSWGGDYFNNIKPLLNTQKRLIKIITFKTEISENLFLNARKLYIYNILIYLYKNRSVCKIKEPVSYSLRNKFIYEIPKLNREIFRKSFAYLAPKIYNSLPENIQNSVNITTFKRELKMYIIFSDEESMIKSEIF